MQKLYDNVNVIKLQLKTLTMFVNELDEEIGTTLQSMGGEVREEHEINCYGWGDPRNPFVGCCDEHKKLANKSND